MAGCTCRLTAAPVPRVRSSMTPPTPAVTSTEGMAASTTVFTSLTETALEVGDVARSGDHAGREAQGRVGGPAGHLDLAGGALGVARQGEDARLDRGPTASNLGVDDRRELVGRGGADVGEVGRSQGHGLLGASVEAEGERLSVRERERSSTASGNLSRRPVEGGIFVCPAVHRKDDAVAVVEDEGLGRSRDHHGRSRRAGRSQEAEGPHCGGRCRIGDVGVMHRAHDPELATSVFEEAHGGERQVRVGREAAEAVLELLEGGAEHRLVDGAALGDADHAGDGGRESGDTPDLGLLLDDDNLGRK